MRDSVLSFSLDIEKCGEGVVPIATLGVYQRIQRGGLPIPYTIYSSQKEETTGNVPLDNQVERQQESKGVLVLVQ